LAILASNVARYLRIILKYKFELVVDAAYLGATMIAFGFIGNVVSPDPRYLDYPFQTFILVNIFFWAFMENGYVEATRIIPEEARLGTLGTLMNNNVSPLTLIVSQMAARSIVNAFMAVAIFLPVFALTGIRSPSLGGLGYLAVVILLSWAYVLTVAVLMGSLSLMFKKIGATAGVFLQVLKVGSGFFFPVAAFASFAWPVSALPGLLRIIPVTRGLEVCREIIILGRLPTSQDSLLALSGVSLDPILLMTAGVAAGVLICVAFYRWVERRAMTFGAIEHY